MNSTGDDVVGSLCAADGPKGVTGQSVSEGKVICQLVEPIVIDRAAYNQGANAAYPPPHRADGGHGRAGCPRAACDSVQLSSGDDVMGTLCADDHKGVNSQYVNDGKVICQRITC